MVYQNIVDALCTILQKHKVLKPTDSDSLKKKFLDHNGRIFEDFLMDQGVVTKEQLLDALSELYSVAAIDARGVFFDHHLLRMFPKDILLRHCFIPYDRDGDVLMVIASNPNNATLEQIIGDYVSYDVTFFVGIPRAIIDAIEDYYDLSITERELDIDPIEQEQIDKEAEDIIENLHDQED
jgi:MshEN domain